MTSVRKKFGLQHPKALAYAVFEPNPVMVSVLNEFDAILNKSRLEFFSIEKLVKIEPTLQILSYDSLTFFILNAYWDN